MELRKRKCRKSDYDFVYRIARETLFPIIHKYVEPDKEKFDNSFLREYKSFVILMMGKRRIGFYQLQREGNVIHIVKIFLSPAYHGRGIGRELMGYFETLGARKLVLQVWDNNPAYKFYKKLGYKRVLKKNHKIFMEKDLR
jgi:ribosomal protein S18 acetylase RimI-like enzyme